MENKPDFIFEISWEVCNKVGGIHTVITSKMPILHETFGENMAFIGPDLLTDNQLNAEFEEDKTLYPDWKKRCEADGLRIRVGRWKTAHKPMAVLIDFSGLINQKDKIFTEFWEQYQVDSLTGSWDYIEAMLFGYASGKVIESFARSEQKGMKVLAHFHEWMTGAGVLYLKNAAQFVATAFTTHATTIGRSIAGNGLPLYNKMTEYDPDQKSSELNIRARYSVEQKAAQNADVFTTVSQVTGNECKYLLKKEPDFITPNGFDLSHIHEITEETRSKARESLCKHTNLLTGAGCSDDTLFAVISGRYEFKNKGIDVFMDVIGKLKNNTNLSHPIIGFVMVPTHNYGVQRDLQCNIENNTFSPVAKPQLTHMLDENAYDPVMDKCHQLQLYNSPEDNVKLIFVPVYLNGNDGVFNMSYYELLSACDVSIFPSYYEPWGYTPHESIALGVPTITTSISGFGQWMRDKSVGIEQGVQVIERNEDNYWDVVDSIVKVISRLNGYSEQEKIELRNNSMKLAKSASWNDFVKIYLDAYEMAIDKTTKRIKEGGISTMYLSKEESKPVSNEPVWKKLYIQSDLPTKLKKLNELSMNLWWCWNYEAIELFEAVHPKYWEKYGKNPLALIKAVSIDRFKELEKDKAFCDKLDKVYDKFEAYMNEPHADLPSISYFSMEYGLDDSVKIYSGGLGILAGDYLKEASDINCPLTGVGFLYKYGYFTQQISVSGEQHATMVPQNLDLLPLTPVFDDLRRPLMVSVNMPGRIVKVKVWKLMVGRIPLYLLDTDVDENNQEDRGISHSLYGGDWENRLKQEMLLGLGGIRVLKALGINSEVYHCNEGHAALINVERISNLVQEKNLTFEQALEVVRASSLFTTHTPVPAGHDEFEESLIRTYLRHMPERMKVEWNTFLNLGRGNINSNDKFSMSVLAARTSQEMNGVSKLHGQVSKDMFHYMWKGYSPEELHIDYVTNGVHLPTWTASEWQKLYVEEFGAHIIKMVAGLKVLPILEYFRIPDQFYFIGQTIQFFKRFVLHIVPQPCG
jgi:phosphorylase/glycogen(starch) synthase